MNYSVSHSDHAMPWYDTNTFSALRRDASSSLADRLDKVSKGKP